jgi:hypothetical protein
MNYKAKAILGSVEHYLRKGDYPHLTSTDYEVVADALRQLLRANPEEATVLQTEGVAQIEYRIVGNLDAVLAEIKNLLRLYDPRQFGTHVHWLDMEEDGTYMARVSRSKT